jgi:hypothetical protein
MERPDAETGMKRGALLRLVLILGGYALAALAGAGAVALNVARTSGPDAQASAGMHAFGDLMLFVGVTGVLSLAPTALAVQGLRRPGAGWDRIATALLALAATGPLAALLAVLPRLLRAPVAAMEAVSALAFLRLLLAPLGVLALAVIAALAPAGTARRRLLLALACEGAALAYLVLHLAFSTVL